MDKSRLTQIILRDLDEIKNLAEEITQSDEDSEVIISLSISKSKLLTKELELLFRINEKNNPKSDPFSSVNSSNVVSDDVIEEEYKEPDFEIHKPDIDENEVDENEISEYIDIDSETGNEEEEFEAENEEFLIEDDRNPDLLELDESDAEDEDDLIVVDKELEEKDNDGVIVYEEDEDEFDSEDEIAEETDIDDSDDEYIEDDSSEEAEQQISHLNTEDKTGVREIYIDDLDDEEIEPFEIKEKPKVFAKPTMREIPKPEEPITEDTKAAEKTIVGEKFQKERSLNDAIGETKSTEQKFAQGPILNLKSAIGLNDRFIFIREIFDNNTEKYNAIIDQLDKFETIQQAVDYLKVNLTLQKNETSLKFVDLLKRRFSN